MPTKLTKTVARAFPTPEWGYVRHWDAELAGFGVRVTASGARSWIVTYRADGKQRTHTIGGVDEISAEAARRKAAEAKTDARAGRDIVAERREARRRAATPEVAPKTLAEFAEEFHGDYCSRKKSGHQDRRYIDTEIVPVLGQMALADVRTADVRRLHVAIGESGRETTANRVRALLSTMFEEAERLELRPQGTNPTKHVKRFREQGRERFLSEDELEAFGIGLRKALEARPEWAMQVAAIRLLAMTGCRKREILDRRWTDFDARRGLLKLPDSKTGARNVILSREAILLVRGLPRPSEWMFPSTRKAGAVPVSDLRDVIAKACELAEPKALDPFRVHDLRHTHASMGLALGQSLPMIGAQLGHRRASTTERYAHSAESWVRGGADQTQGHIASIIAPASAGGDPDDLRAAVLTKLDGLDLTRPERKWLRAELERDRRAGAEVRAIGRRR